MIGFLKGLFQKSEKQKLAEYQSGLYERGLRFFELGKKFNSLRQDKEALESLDIAIECGIKEAYSLRSWVLQSLDFNYEAIEDFDEAIKLEPLDCNLYNGRHFSKIYVGDFDGALNDITVAIELSKQDNHHTEVYNELVKEQGYNSVTDTYLPSYLTAKEYIDNPIRKILSLKLNRRQKK